MSFARARRPTFDLPEIIGDSASRAAPYELVLFKGCTNHEYRNQAIKILRAVEGEHAHTSYRLDWVAEEAIHLLDSVTTPLCYIVFVDREWKLSIPARAAWLV